MLKFLTQTFTMSSLCILYAFTTLTATKNARYSGIGYDNSILRCNSRTNYILFECLLKFSYYFCTNSAIWIWKSFILSFFIDLMNNLNIFSWVVGL